MLKQKLGAYFMTYIASKKEDPKSKQRPLSFLPQCAQPWPNQAQKSGTRFGSLCLRFYFRKGGQPVTSKRQPSC